MINIQHQHRNLLHPRSPHNIKPKYIIWHISDIHIRNGIYNDILFAIDQLVDHIKISITKSEPNTNLVVIAGDVFEHKSYVHVNDFPCLDEILNRLSPTPVVIIPGNHDFDKNIGTNLLSVALRNSKPGVHLFTNTGIYQIPNFNINFHIWSPIDGPKKPSIEGEQTLIEGGYNIAILHDLIPCSEIYSTRSSINITDLNNYDAVLAGDIHRPQIFGNKRHIAYSGSLIQKHRGEELHHGCIKWTLSDKIEAEQINFCLNSAYLKIHARDNQLYLPDERLYKNIKYIEFNHSNTTAEQVEAFVNVLKEKYGFINKINDTNNTQNADYVIAPGTFSQSEVQLNLLKTVLESEPRMEEILAIHNQLVATTELPTKKKWRLESLYWENVFCYNESNYINFNNLKGLNSIIGKNMVGKSSIIDILLLILYNQQLRADAANVIRHNCENYKIICQFSIVGNEGKYIIIRNCVITGKRNSPQVKFVRTTGDEISNLTGTTIPKTYEAIRELIGDNEELLTINIAIQNNVPIMDRGEKEQISIFHKYFELDRFDILHSLTTAKVKEFKLMITSKEKDLEKFKTEQTADILQSQKQELAKEIKLAKQKRKELSADKDKLNVELGKHDDSRPAEEIKKELDTIKIAALIAYNEENLQKDKTARDELGVELKKLRNQLKNVDVAELPTLEEKLKQFSAEIVPRETEVIINRLTELQQSLQIPKYNVIDESRLILLTKQMQNNNNQKIATPYTLADLDKISSDFDEAKLIKYEEKIKEIKQKLIELERYHTKLTNFTKEELIKTMTNEKLKDQKEEDLLAGKSFDMRKIHHLPKTLRPVQSRAELEKLREQILDQHTYEKLKYNEKCESCQHNLSLRPPVTGLQLKEINGLFNLTTAWENYELQQKLYIINDYNFLKRQHLENELTKITPKVEQWQGDLKIYQQKNIIRQNANIQEYEDLTNSQKIIANNILIKRQIAELQKELTLQNQYAERQTLEKKIADIKYNNELMNKMGTMVQKHKQLDIAITKYQLNNELLQKKIKYNIILNKLTQLQKIETDLNSIEEQLATAEDKLRQVTTDYEKATFYKQISEEIIQLKNELYLYTKYEECINIKKGIPYKILRTACHNLESYINDILKRITNFTITFNFSDRKFQFLINENDNITLAAKQASGFQKFILDMALRLALIKDHPYLPDFFIIDEGFGCMDEEHLANLREFMEKLNNQDNYHFIIFISHIETLNNLVNGMIIKREGGISQIQIGDIPEYPENAISFLTAPVPENPSTEELAEIFEYRENSRIYCKYCDKEYKKVSGFEVRHINTKIHKSNVG